MNFTEKLEALKARQFDLKNRRWINAGGRPATILSEQTASGAEVLQRIEMARREAAEFIAVAEALEAMLDEAARDLEPSFGASIAAGIGPNILEDLRATARRPGLEHERAKAVRAKRRKAERCGHPSEVHKGATCVKRKDHLGAHQWSFKP